MSRVYERILQHAYTLAAYVAGVEPVIGPPPTMPKQVAPDEIVKIEVLTAAHASSEVRVLAQSLGAKVRLFTLAARRGD